MRVPTIGIVITKDASFRKIVGRHSQEMGQRYTQALNLPIRSSTITL